MIPHDDELVQPEATFAAVVSEDVEQGSQRGLDWRINRRWKVTDVAKKVRTSCGARGMSAVEFISRAGRALHQR